MDATLPPPPPGPPPATTPDGTWMWNGVGWVSTRPPIGWEMITAQVLVIVESALVLVTGLLITLAVGATGLLVNADNGGAGLHTVGTVVLVILAVTAVLSGLLIYAGVRMARGRRARALAVILQVVFLLVDVVAWVLLVVQPAPAGSDGDVASVGSSGQIVTNVLAVAVPALVLALVFASGRRSAGHGPTLPGARV